MSQLRVYVDIPSLVFIERELGMLKNKSKHVLRAAINKTAKETMLLLTNSVNDRYYVQRKTHIAKTMDLKKATVGNLVATITSTGQTTDLYDFKITPKPHVSGGGPPGGRKANVVRTNPMKALEITSGGRSYKAFTVRFKNKMKNGGIALSSIKIAQRIPGSHMRSNYSKEALKVFSSSSIPKMMEKVWGSDYEVHAYETVNAQVKDLLNKNIMEQITRFVG